MKKDFTSSDRRNHPDHSGFRMADYSRNKEFKASQLEMSINLADYDCYYCDLCGYWYVQEDLMKAWEIYVTHEGYAGLTFEEYFEKMGG